MNKDTPVFRTFQRNLRIVGQLRLERGDWIAWQCGPRGAVFAGEVKSLPTRHRPNVWVETVDGSTNQVYPPDITSVNGRPVRVRR